MEKQELTSPKKLEELIEPDVFPVTVRAQMCKS